MGRESLVVAASWRRFRSLLSGADRCIIIFSKTISGRLSFATSVIGPQRIPASFHRHENRSPFVLEQDDQDFCRLGLACAPADDMNIFGTLVEGLSRGQRHFWSSFHLHYHGTFEHVNEAVRMMHVHRVPSARRILYGKHQDFLTG